MPTPSSAIPTGPKAMRSLSIKGTATAQNNGPDSSSAMASDERDRKRLVRHTAAPRDGEAVDRDRTHSDSHKDRREGRDEGKRRLEIRGSASRDDTDQPDRLSRDKRPEDKRAREGNDPAASFEPRRLKVRGREELPEARTKAVSPRARSRSVERKGHERAERRSRSRSDSRERTRRSDSRDRQESRSRKEDERHRIRHDDSRSRKDETRARRDSHSHRRRRSRSTSSNSSESEDSEEEERRRRRKRRKEKERRREEEEKEERKRRRKEKEGKEGSKHKERRKSNAAPNGQWGKYGVITENDQMRLIMEFRAWLVEQRRLDPDLINRDKSRREFAVFVEEFNTATLPHEKYYDMAQHQAKMSAMRNGEQVVERPKYDPRADEKAHIARLRASHLPEEADLTREELIELRRLEKERIEAGKRRQLGLEIPKGLGVRMVEVPIETWKDPNQF